MNNSTAPFFAPGQILAVSRGDRWSVYRRLQELNIPCDCPADGTIRVNINGAIALALVHSTVRQFTLPISEAVDWLERCWENQVACPVDR